MTTHPDLQTLRAFVAVARSGNVSREARQSCLSQPAVSLQLKSLAEPNGLLLSTRTPHGLVLSRHGALHRTGRPRQRLATVKPPERATAVRACRPAPCMRVGAVRQHGLRCSHKT